MKVSEGWLREWISTPLNAQELGARLTMAGLEVDQVHVVAAAFNQVVVAHVISTHPHPEADRLTVCQVEAGTGQVLQIVCGAANVRTGLRVALALPGANLPGDMSITETTLRGQLSQGMLCSLRELRLSDESNGIMELPDDAPIGTSLREYLALDDHVLDINLTPNRADCLSILGVARELSALLAIPYQPIQPIELPQTTPVQPPQLTVMAPTGCPSIAMRVIQGINPHASTPLWLKERLRRCGLNALHPVVDVINYVMLELGQPMHAYDLSQLSGDMQVRFASELESLTLLNGQQLTLHSDSLVIADANGPQALAGIMGGEQTAIQSQTVDILLESAYFDPICIAHSARRHGLSSDACMRFERGVDPALHQHALARVTELLLSIVGGEAGTVVMAGDTATARRLPVIAFNPNTFVRITGFDLPAKTMVTILRGLGLDVDDSTNPWQVRVPSYRFDITLDVDLVEEILRVYGYDHLPQLPIIAPIQVGCTDSQQQIAYTVSRYLADCGYHETISYSFVEPTLQRVLYPDTPVLTLLNPISSELSEMRVGLWPGLIATYLYNSHRQQPHVRCFETGIVFAEERLVVAGILSGVANSCDWAQAARQYDFYDMKGDVESLAAHLRITLDYQAALNPALHPGQSAQLIHEGRAVGWIGALHPRIMLALDLTTPVYVFELDLQACVDAPVVRYQRISKYPQIRRDLALLVDEARAYAEIEHVMRAVIPAQLLKALQLFDEYRGESLPQGKKSMAIALTLQDEHRTLVDEEVNDIISATLHALNEKLDIILRD
jgi:phenylalanyl-tRNA synthetase beta chain